MSDVSKLAVGWSCGAYSNKETFARAAAESFVRAGSTIGMSAGFVFPGNARNEQIENKDDESLEQVHVAGIFCHGSPSGPDLEYEPSTLAYWSYRWGDRGTTRWVLIGGCDALGFPVYNDDGSPAFEAYPRVSRYNQAHAGISGICGYRSASYYIPDAQTLTPMNEYGRIDLAEVGGGYTSEFMFKLNALVSFYDAWVHSANWLHARLGRIAETAIFSNGAGALGEHLKAYRNDRRPNVDPAGIRRTMVGKGSGPVYDYCHLVDRNNLCVAPNALEAIKPGSSSEKSTKLPVFSWAVQTSDVKWIAEIAGAVGVAVEKILSVGPGASPLGRGWAVSVNPCGGFALYAPGPAHTASHLQSVLLEENQRGPLQHRETGGLGLPGFGAVKRTIERLIHVGGTSYPVRLDDEVTMGDGSGPIYFEGSKWSILRETDARLLPSLEQAVALVTSVFSAPGARVDVVGSEIVYVKIRRAEIAGLLVPSLQVFVRLSTAEEVRHMTLFF